MRVVGCTVGVTDGFRVQEGLYHSPALSHLSAMVMDRLTNNVRQESPWMTMFADDIVTSIERRERVEEKLETWE